MLSLSAMRHKSTDYPPGRDQARCARWLQELKLCTGYRHGSTIHKDMPADLDVLTGCEPVYQRMKGWTAATTGTTSYKRLPVEAKRYLARIEELAQCRIDMISTGSKRAETIMLRNPMDCSRRRSKRS